MAETPLPNPKKNTFGSSVSFDLEQPPEPKRRKNKSQHLDSGDEHPPPGAEVHGGVDCPGCGSALSNEEWLSALVGFVSGARDFEIGNPVRARIVQTLQNTATNMDTPHPRDVWELSIVSRLMNEIERIVQAEVLRTSADQTEVKYTVSEVQDMLDATALETRNTMLTEVWDEAVLQVQMALEPELRKQIEQELWVEFEAELQRRTA